MWVSPTDTAGGRLPDARTHDASHRAAFLMADGGKGSSNARVATYVSMIEQLGNPYRDVVALTCDAERVNALGLIEIYEAVLFRGRSFTIELGVQYPPADQALF